MAGRKPGTPKTGGRKPGSPNKTTALAREAIAQFVDANSPRLQGWLDDIAADPKHGPLAAFKCVQELLEYHIPKLARTELTGEGGGAVAIQKIERVVVNGRADADTSDA
jgi:hypothetical protein